MVKNVGRRPAKINMVCDETTLTPNAGLAVVAETVAVLGLIDALDSSIGPIKQRQRGLSGGELLVSMAESMLVGGDFLCDLDTLRNDRAGARLRTVPNPPASTTAGELSRRFGPDHLAGIEAGLAQALHRSIRLMDDRQQQRLLGQRPTIDIDPTDVEVYGLDKQPVGFNYAGVRCARPVPATWAQAGWRWRPS